MVPSGAGDGSFKRRLRLADRGERLLRVRNSFQLRRSYRCKKAIAYCGDRFGRDRSRSRSFPVNLAHRIAARQARGSRCAAYLRPIPQTRQAHARPFTLTEAISAERAGVMRRNAVGLGNLGVTE